jgi:hypothetical protein
MEDQSKVYLDAVGMNQLKEVYASSPCSPNINTKFGIDPNLAAVSSTRQTSNNRGTISSVPPSEIQNYSAESLPQSSTNPNVKNGKPLGNTTSTSINSSLSLVKVKKVQRSFSYAYITGMSCNRLARSVMKGDIYVDISAASAKEPAQMKDVNNIIMERLGISPDRNLLKEKYQVPEYKAQHKTSTSKNPRELDTILDSNLIQGIENYVLTGDLNKTKQVLYNKRIQVDGVSQNADDTLQINKLLDRSLPILSHGKIVVHVLRHAEVSS